MSLIDKIKYAADYIRNIYSGKIDVAVILGSGLGSLVEYIDNKVVIKYSDIPNFPKSTVKGHAGELIIGDLEGKKVLAMNGRFHYYEGYSMETVTFPVRVMKFLGVEKLIVTNAAGGMNPEFEPADLMIITDHINMIGDNPLIGPNYDELGARFPDMSNAYDKQLIELAKNCAKRLDIDIKEGVYIPVSGPNYETPAELKMLRTIGGDAVGMSTVPEVIVANHMSMKVLGVSCITDMALADELEPLEHSKVVETANRAQKKFVNLVKEVIKEL
ncbi:purine nucleoside phosphorylase 1 [Clostridium tepidiprofundi DSM 19306]|uniref:Purine nucleoside phosphorylase n=1 Tax=Clostridium tepidiprofundi DSM 19306 TaxID=1121338 RepID=A0A151B7E3_9CLOT|nr:purine-nucleoside phosphorylase [Clostridium tepidiprofundi]KYH35710.1 purine nucleoside phosphorylase 1 [Clostridium tepidiprofundi DSM 19306]